VRGTTPTGVRRLRFEGQIAGLGTAEGTRIVVGRWLLSPLGAFADVMVERPGGHRLLLAPNAQVRDFVSSTYSFDETVEAPVLVSSGAGGWVVDAGPLRLAFGTGARTPLGWLLRGIPPAVARAPWFATAVDPVARVVLGGVRTKGTAGGGRREWYGASDVHRIVSATASWDGDDLGELRPVRPAVRFGFGSTPAQPSVTSVVSTVQVPL